MAINIILVAFGGALGSVARYLTTRFSAHLFGIGFPWGTVIVNLVGSFLIGFISAIILAKTENPEPLRLLLITGFLGGFTTFSAFSLDVINLLSRGSYSAALAYIALSVVPAIIATFLGLAFGRALL